MKVIYAIPGLGTGKELFDNLSVRDHVIKVLTWPATSKKQDLPQYAEKFLEQIDVAKPVILLGVSFGGMLCVELAHKIQGSKLILISSCKDSSEFPPLFTFFKKTPVHKLFPDTLLRAVAKKAYRWFGVPMEYKKPFNKMIDGMSKDYFAHCLPALYRWKRKSVSIPVVHIHGTKDNVLPHRYIKSFKAIERGTHFMVVDRAVEINQILNKELNGL